MTDSAKPSGDESAKDPASTSSPPEFGSPFDYDATADASLTESTSGTSAVPPSGGNTAGPGWDTFSGVGNGPGWGTGPTYPPPVGDQAFPTSGPVFGTPQPEYGQPTMPPPSMGYPQAPAPGYPSAPGYPAAPGYTAGYGDPSAPFGRDPITGEPFSDKSKVMAGLLQLVLSFFWVPGVGRLYAGNTGLGLVQLLGFWGCCLLTLVLLPLTALFLPLFLIPGLGALGIWLWAVVDGIMILVGTVRDGQGRKLRS